MKARRGVALITALWLVVAIAVVALQFSVDARERRTLGIGAADRGVQRALAGGALKLVEAKLDYAIRTIGTSGGKHIDAPVIRSMARRRLALLRHL